MYLPDPSELMYLPDPNKRADDRACAEYDATVARARTVRRFDVASAWSPVDQVRTGRPQGQCTEAAIASVLGVGLGEIPDLWGGGDIDTDEERPIRRWIQVCAFILSKGYQFVRFTIPSSTLPLDLEALDLPREARFCARGAHLLAGENPDGIGHMCVGVDGVLVHDPNPSRNGLVTVDEVIVFMPLDMIEDDCIHWLMRDYRQVDGEWKLSM